MSLLAVAVGLGAGVAGALAHLLVTRARARWALTRGPVFVVATLPLALLGPALAVLLAARVAPLAAWLVPVGLLVGRALLLGPMARRQP